MSLQALIFDLDGTLADTERDAHRVAFNLAFRDAGLDWQWSVDEYGRWLAITGGKERIASYAQAEHGLAEKEARELGAKLHTAKNRHFAVLMERSDIPLRPGVRALLEQGRRERVRLAIATTGQPENVNAILRSTLGPDGERWFEVIGAGDIVKHKKPAPDIYHWVLERLALRAEQCVAVEDSENGLRAALAAGLPTLVCTNEYTRNQNFSGALAVVEDLDGVDLDYVRRLVRQ